MPTDIGLSDRMTDFNTETKAQQAWRPRPRWRAATIFDDLVRNEFALPQSQVDQQIKHLSRVMRWASAKVPHYRDAFRERGLTADNIREARDLLRLPILSKREVQQQFSRLQPRALPRGDQPGGISQSSGTSGGRPTRVAHSNSSRAMFGPLKQRELRWFRFDSTASLAWIRLPDQLPPDANGNRLPDGATLRRPGWPLIDDYFETGAFFAFGVTNPIAHQVEWLERHRPRYLMAYAESLEHLAFAWGNRPPPSWLGGLLAISEQVPPGMRAKVERTFDAPMHENYGLNEVGVVASRCPEGGRFHVHREFCIVEIVDDSGFPVAAGETGRLLVTVLVNPAMPLIRYDTGDLARAADEQCPCGRTLPSFDQVVGRYSRIAYLPEGTLGLVGAIREAVESMPEPLVRTLREFQIHQGRDGTLELRLVADGILGAAFTQRVETAFEKSRQARDAMLRIKYVGEIPRAPGGKFRDFTSDYMPDADNDLAENPPSE